jgi:hypothetical protein
MVPFSFKWELSYSRGMKKSIYTLRPGTMGPASRWSRVMKERSLPSSPLTGAKRAYLPTFFISPNWVPGVDHRPSRWSGKAKLPLCPNKKKLPVCQCCHRKIPMNQIPFRKPNRHPASFIFYPCPSVSIIRGLKNQSYFRRFKVI